MKSIELCKEHCDHSKELENIHIPNEEVLYDIAELFKVFGDSTRVRILSVLFEKEVRTYHLLIADLIELPTLL